MPKKKVPELSKLSIEIIERMRNWSNFLGAFAYVLTVFLL